MRLQKAACEHSGSDELIDAGSGEDSVALDLREHLNHVTRRDDVAKAKTRGEDLREGAEADRAVRRQIPDGDRRLLFVPEFAIRIVFNDPEIVLLGFFNQLLPALSAHRLSGRIAVSGERIGKPDTARFFPDFSRSRAFSIRRHFNVRRLREVESFQGANIGRTLNQNL